MKVRLKAPECRLGTSFPLTTGDPGVMGVLSAGYFFLFTNIALCCHKGYTISHDR